MKELNDLITAVSSSINSNEFIKITLSKPKDKNSTLLNAYIRFVLIKSTPSLSFNFRYKTNDQTKNFSIDDGCKEIQRLLQTTFQIATLFTTVEDIVLQTNKNGKTSLLKTKASLSKVETLDHDRQKIRRAAKGDLYLTLLGINDKEGNLIPKMADKFRQINKYLEIMEDLLKASSLPKQPHIVDMGSGKGYLTFALYDFLKNKLNLPVTVTGIELRPDLVHYCNGVAKECGFEGLEFICQPIEDYKDKPIDVLIALHACDTATDDALFKGIVSNASLIVCAPCCHKQIRQQVKGIEQESPLLKYGIFKERQFEMITDTIRALILEKYQYQTKVFEFISNEHTRKNVMLVGSRTKHKADADLIASKIDSLKNEYHIQQHYLEMLMEEAPKL